MNASEGSIRNTSPMTHATSAAQNHARAVPEAGSSVAAVPRKASVTAGLQAYSRTRNFHATATQSSAAIASATTNSADDVPFMFSPRATA